MVEDDETNADVRGFGGRVLASIVIAIVAYFGLLFGGNVSIGPTSSLNSFSAGKESQPLHVTARDAVRGILVPDRKLLAKAGGHDPSSAALPPLPAVSDLPRASAPHADMTVVPIQASVSYGYRPRGPPPEFA
ncbi:hypothetical protein AAE029_22650 [Sinorhizobium sp. CB7]